MFSRLVRFRMLATLAFAALFGSSACDNHGYYQSPGPVRQQVQAQTTAAINAEDFDLQSATSLVSDGSLLPQAVEQKINDPASGINNVDVDKDGAIDYVTVRESASGNAHVFEFLANPSGQPGAQPTLIASTTLTQQGQQIAVQAAYPSYVTGYQNYGYNTYVPYVVGRPLWTYMFAPHAYYAPAYMPSAYVRRSVVAPTVVTQQRSTFQTTTKMAPIPRSAPPASYQQPASAQRVPAAVQVPRATGSITGNARQQQDFRVRDTTQARPTGNSFGAAAPRQAAPAPSAPRQSAPATRTFSRPASRGRGR